jgi:hypothetical protein
MPPEFWETTLHSNLSSRPEQIFDLCSGAISGAIFKLMPSGRGTLLLDSSTMQRDAAHSAAPPATRIALNPDNYRDLVRDPTRRFRGAKPCCQ